MGRPVSAANFSFDFATSEIVFDPGFAPAAAAAVTAGFEFDVPVRFDTEQLSISLAAFKAGRSRPFRLIEVSL